MTKLRESHERALRSSLYIIEENLQRIRNLLTEGNSTNQTITYRIVDNLDAESKPKIVNFIADMLDEIRQIKETFELETERINLRAEILAALDEVWIILVDLGPERLKAYGELLASEKALIEPHTMSLQDRLEMLRRLLREQKT
ncbi:MAG: hypothetical protein NWE98_08310 [Candidatus Bathyarchaeota archaeon]|nr:hypothetical protein [Candidatus Bathyarchaeota archaeon]